MAVPKLIFAAFLLLCCASQALALTLVKHGKPTALIVLPAAATAVDRKAAEELQRYLKLMSGAEMPIVTEPGPPGTAILIGRQEASVRLVGDLIDDRVLGYDGVILRTVGDKLVVLGNHGQGQLYAVYELLKRLGCRFYLPYPDGEVIPRRGSITVGDLDYVHKPTMARREFWNNGYVRPGLAHQEWYEHWADQVCQGGVKIWHGHNYMYFCPADKYFDAHPEYFPLQPGKDGKMARTRSGQLCLSNPDVVKLAADAATAYFDSDPTHRGYSLSPNDTKGWCQCEACKAMDSPDPKVGVAWRVLKFNNQVAEIVARKYPDRWLCYYAEYMNLPGPPVGLKAHPMIMPVIVDRYDMMHPIDDPYMGDTSKTGIHYNPDYKRIFEEWHKIARQISVYEWYQLGKPPQLPAPMLYTIGDRMSYYAKQGVLGYYGEIIGRSPVNDLTMYIGAQMAWDASQDDKAMLDEFFRLYFAEAAAPMREYYRLLHEVSYFSNDNRGTYVPRTAWTPELTARLYAKLAEAEKLAAQDVVRRRLDRERKSLVATDLSAVAFRIADDWFDNRDAAARARARLKVDEAVHYLKSIADEDIVADTRMVTFLTDLRAQLAR